MLSRINNACRVNGYCRMIISRSNCRKCVSSVVVSHICIGCKWYWRCCRQYLVVTNIQYRSFITLLLHACTRMAPHSIWRVKILGLPWKKNFPRDKSWHLAWHFTTLVLAFPRHVSFPQDVDFHVTSHGIYTATCMTVVIHTVIRQTNPPQILLWL